MSRDAAVRLQALAAPGRIWSHAALSRWETCPHSFLGRYVDQIPDPPSAPLAQGRIVHAAIARLLADPDLTPAAALAAARAAVPATESVTVEAVWLRPLPAGADQPVPADLDLAADEAALTTGRPYAWLQAEDRLRRAGADAVTAGPDVVWEDADGVHLRDWKTGRVPPEGPAALVARYAPQLALYGAVARRRYPGRPLRADLHLLAHGAVVPVALTPADFDTAARRVFQTAQAIRTAARRGRGAFPKRVGEGCRYCPLALAVTDQGAPRCPEGAAHRQAQGWDRWDEANRAARWAAGIGWIGDPPRTAQPTFLP